MLILLEISTATLILVCIGLAFLYKALSAEIDDLVEAVRALSAENTHIKAKIRVIERRFQKIAEPADKIAIVHQYPSNDDLRFPNSEGLC